MVILSVVLYFT